MKTVIQKQLMAEILLVTAAIQKEFPASYSQLSETPLFLSDEDKNIGAADFEQYLVSLKAELQALRDSHTLE